jgi:hypothetical protein
MLKQRRFKQSSIFEYRLEEEAINLRKQAEGMPPGIRREELLGKARQVQNSPADEQAATCHQGPSRKSGHSRNSRRANDSKAS